ncbi:hypothetical protein C2S52_000506 [Perilla frutescens var. hirtella]|nr:hypothetical protein C2S52_000506 [Perilla frutescens var. hirtella]
MVVDLNLSPSCDDDGGENAHNSPEKDKDTPKNEDDDGFDGDVDIGREIEMRLEPGSLVEDIHQAYVLYCEYARCKWFSIRKGCEKYFENSSEIRMKVFNCSCEGQPDNKRSNGRLAIYKKQVTRSNCKARLHVLHERDGPWIVSVFEKVHNHELVNPNESYLLRSSRQLCNAKKSILEAMHSAGIPVTRACKFMKRESGGRQNLGFTRTDAYIHLGRKKSEIKDSRCAIDYEYFKDVISFDTTYKTNKYNMSDETIETFEWLFGVFLEAMYRKELFSAGLHATSRSESAEDALCRGMPGQFLEDSPLLTHIAKLYTRNIYKLFETMCVSFNKETHDVSCSCRMWESKGVFCRHIFKVLYWMNVEVIPERYILRRLTRECKCRCIQGVNSISGGAVNENLSSLLFVNNIIRLTYDLTYELNGDASSRSHKRLEKAEATPHLSENEESISCEKPWKNVRRKWRKKKMKGPKGKGGKLKDDSLVVDSSNEFENSMNSPNDYWPEFCREFSTQQSHLNSITMDVDDSNDNKLEWEERYHQFKWLIDRPDVFYHPPDNIVEASVDVWFEISRIRPNLLFYRPKGEPCWEQMRVLFRETIVLSDTHFGGNA